MFSSNVGQSKSVDCAVDQVLVAQQVRACSLSAGMCARSVIATKALIVLHARGDRLDQRQEGQVEEQDLVFGMVGDPDDLVGMQARVERVQHRARAGDRVVQLQVAVAVPGQRGDAVAELDAAAPASALAMRRERAASSR